MMLRVRQCSGKVYSSETVNCPTVSVNLVMSVELTARGDTALGVKVVRRVGVGF